MDTSNLTCIKSRSSNYLGANDSRYWSKATWKDRKGTKWVIEEQNGKVTKRKLVKR